MRARYIRTMVILLALLLPATGARAMQQAFLVQNSGWMEPFYLDQKSQFKPLVAAVIEAAGSAGDQLFVLSFNQSTKNNPSPVLAFQGQPGPGAGAAVKGIVLARQGQGGALADTDFNEAVFKTITGHFKSTPGIIWIFTNNKNSPNNSHQTAAMNRRFYGLIHNDPAITRSMVFPLAMQVAGPKFRANGMMIYALAYGVEADTHLRALLTSGRLSKVLTQQPAQLKPLDRDAIRLVPKLVQNAPNTRASLARDGRSLILDIDVGSKVPVVQLLAGMENLFFPYQIDSASVTAQLAGKGFGGELVVAPGELPPLKPGQAVEVRVAVPIGVTMPSPWSLSGLAQFGRSLKYPAVVRVRLDNQKLLVDEAFRQRLRELFPGDPMPEIFQPPAEVKYSVAEIPLAIRVNYPVYPLVIAMGLLLGLLGGGLFAFMRRGLSESYNLLVDGVARKVSVGRLSSVPVMDPEGKVVAVIKRGLGKPAIKAVSENHTVYFR